jgi:protein kinase A
MSRILDPDSIDILQTLGTGAFGRVRLARVKSTGEYIAVKSLKKLQILKTKQMDHVYSEYNILRTTNHPLLVNLKGFYQDPSYLYFGMEFVPGGDLFTYLRRIGRFNSNQSMLYASQIILMFEYLHSMDIVYRDLKPENLLIGSDGYLKLTDFGFAKIVTERTYTLCGTPEYIAPEVLLNKGHGKPVDWWTTGVLIYEMLAGIDPFNDDDPMAIYQKILRCKYKFPKGFDDHGKSLVKHILVLDLSKRYGNLRKGVDDFKKHRWFKGLNWNSIATKQTAMPYIPQLSSLNDTSHFNNYPDSYTKSPPLISGSDPFLDWET